jgi:UDPglucose 6-dehydrogenase/GDP-mannose 6-dehydrogenase
MIKYASNALLATLISWSNEMAQLCEALPGVDVAQVMPAVHASAYLSPRMPDGTVVRAPIAGFIEAGCGFGGSCLPKDVAALVAQGQSLGQPMRLLSATLRINEEQPARLLALLREHYPDLEGVSVAVLGLAFRPGTDDTRQSPAWPIIEALRRAGAQVSVHDPVAKLPEPYKPGVRQIASLRQALIQADAVMLITRWPEYAALDQILASLGHAPLVIDGRRILKPEKFARYEGIGRPSLRATQAHATA